MQRKTKRKLKKTLLVGVLTGVALILLEIVELSLFAAAGAIGIHGLIKS